MIARWWDWLLRRLGLRQTFVAPKPKGGVSLGGAAKTEFIPFNRGDRG
jgi:hypothetical protein